MPDRATGSVPGTVGRVMPNTELRVVDVATGRDLGAGQPGELLARGPQVMAGYLRRPDATAAMVDPDGWLRTGDLGLVDGDGNVVIVDRLKELIKVSGHHVAPAELEALLATHPAVADAAVLRPPRPRRGRGPGGRGGAPTRGRRRGRGAPGLGGRAGRAAQAAPGGPLRRRHPPHALGQAAAPGPARPGPPAGLTRSGSG
jgi:hypothetical protein